MAMYLSWLPEDIWNPSPVSIAIAIATVLAVALYYYIQQKDLPPGPIGLPFIGIWPFLDRNGTHLHLDAYKKKYGDVFSFTSAGTLFIHLGSTKALREAHITKVDCFSQRANGYSLVYYIFGGGLVASGGDQWKTLRKFFMTVMRERGMGALKDSMSGPFYDSINTTINEIREKAKKGEPVPIVKILEDKCNTIMRLTLFGEVGAKDEELKEINRYYDIVVNTIAGINMLLYGNIAKYFIFPFTPGYKTCHDNLKLIKAAIFKMINEHKATYNQDNLRDLIDDYISERKLRESKGDPTAKHFTDHALMATLVQVLGDGVLSVALFIAMFLRVLLENPEEQDKIYKELIEVIGTNRQPTIEDKSNLTYTNAFLQETLRTTDFFPMFPSLECTKETTVGGYRIPKGSITLMNVFSAHNDPNVYKEPEKFDPSRFIVTAGKQRPELPVTFGAGRRSCIGEGFTMTQIFTFLTSMIKSFHFKLPQGTTESTFELIFTGKLEVIATPRKEGE